MSPVVLSLVLALSLGAIGWMLNHAMARLAFVEFALSSGIPESAAIRVDAGSGELIRTFQPLAAAARLPEDAVVVFASQTCVSCTRLIDELAAPDVALEHPLVVYFSGAKVPVEVPGMWFEGRQDLFDEIGVPATPYAAVTVGGELRAHGPVADARRLQGLMVTAGLPGRLPLRLLAQS